MPTNDERREVATKLRNVTDEDCDMCFLEEILADCVGDAYVHYSGCQLDYRLLINGLAELIEPEPKHTCKMKLIKRGPIYTVWRFSCCGYEYSENNTDSGATGIPETVCPKCGTKVEK